MAKTLQVVFYDTRTLALRSLVVVDDDSHVAHQHPAPGETKITVYAPGRAVDIETARDAIRKHSGREPPTLEQIHKFKL